MLGCFLHIYRACRLPFSRRSRRQSTLAPSKKLAANRTLSTMTASNSAQGTASAISHESLSRYNKNFYAHPKNRLALNAVARGRIPDIILNHEISQRINHQYSDKIETEGKITNQKSSGRCWLFAGLNVMRLNTIAKHKIEDFELSQGYLYFYDKIEKANWFLESMIELAGHDLEDRTVQFLLKDPVQDGGQWDMFVSLVEKYGVVPKAFFPETAQTINTAQSRTLITSKLREFAEQIRNLHSAGKCVNTIRAAKDEMLDEIYRIMCITCGEPPKHFTWSFRDKDKKFHEYADLTPQSFYHDHVAYNVTETVSLINDPRNEYYKLYTVAYLGNIKGGHSIRYINLPVEELKQLGVKTIQSGKPVWFGCDVGKHFARQIGVLELNSLDWDLGFGVTFDQDKANRLRYGESAMTHAMMFTGVHLNADGQPQRWRVENSWGEDNGDKGFLSMSDKWFSEFTYQIVLEKSDVPDEVLKVLEQEPVVLPPWDPMGSLA
ncbi:peptidase C1B, bleomycin hydrolase [Syncephalis fuscata]|nr:peptidase C1B, bleomycin hydrolase [Syncephalis fuscata]